jgi:aspartyl-tRNA(Asn)/glutamyl-tRNA(Gln) amidotransferase subunit A
MNECISLTATELREHLLKGDLTAVELCQAHLERIDESNPTLNSFITVSHDQALEQAKLADRILESLGQDSPQLTGIPIAVKDLICTRGIETTCASKILRGFVPPYDATTITKLKQAGAVVVGKTNLDEFAMGGSNEHSAFGAVKNPWDLERVPGGSSGGSAAAVCSGQAPLSLGTDTGGSIRQPAGLTGIIGLKPTYGRVSRYGVAAFASSLEQVGPFARSVEDIALIMGELAGFDPSDATTMRVAVPNYSAELSASPRDLKGLRVGVPRQYFIDGMDKEVEQAVRNGLSTLEELGATLVEISLPHTEHALSVYYVLAPAEASSNLARYDGVRYGARKEGETLSQLYARTRGEGFGPEVKRRILIGTYVLSKGYFDAYYLKAQAVRTLIINDFKEAFTNSCDIIATPVSPNVAWRFGERDASPVEMYLEDAFTLPVNLAGLPGISVPAGLHSMNLPIGLQLIAPPFEELRLMVAARNFLSVSSFDFTKMTRRTFSQ